jgi:hypothetical protein
MLTRYKDVDTLRGDLMLGAGSLAVFHRGEDTPSARRAIYHQYEQGRLLGAFKYGSLIAGRKSTTLAAMWAEETKHIDAPTVQLMELRLQLNELATALAECGGDQSDVATLRALLDVTRESICAALKIRSRNHEPAANHASGVRNVGAIGGR